LSVQLFCAVRLVAVIPALDEEETIGEVIDSLEHETGELDHELDIVVSSGSTDGTDKIVREKGYTVIDDGGKGLGLAMYRGLKEALEHDPDAVFSIDADFQFRPSELRTLLKELENTEAELVLGSRFLENGIEYRMSLSHRLGNWFLTVFTNLLTGLSLTDAQTGYRVMKPEVAEDLEMIGNHTYVQETVLDASMRGYIVSEVAVHFDLREHGSSRVASSLVKYGIRTLPVLVWRRIRG
jgi:glycosyltransferase involved in cell wall biosynthesis